MHQHSFGWNSIYESSNVENITAKNTQVSTLHVKLYHQSTFLQFCHDFIPPSFPILFFLCLGPSREATFNKLHFGGFRKPFFIPQHRSICLGYSSQDWWKPFHHGSSMENITFKLFSFFFFFFFHGNVKHSLLDFTAPTDPFLKFQFLFGLIYFPVKGLTFLYITSWTYPKPCIC